LANRNVEEVKESALKFKKIRERGGGKEGGGRGHSELAARKKNGGKKEAAKPEKK